MDLLRLCSPPRQFVCPRKTKALSSLYLAEQFHAILEREKARVDRNTHHLSLVLFKLSNAEEKVFQVCYLTYSLANRIRWTGEVGWFDNRGIEVVLPDTTAVGAQRLADSVCEVFIEKTSIPQYTVYTYPSTSFPNGNGHSSQLSFEALLIPRKEVPLWAENHNFYTQDLRGVAP